SPPVPFRVGPERQGPLATHADRLLPSPTVLPVRHAARSGSVLADPVDATSSLRFSCATVEATLAMALARPASRETLAHREDGRRGVSGDLGPAAEGQVRRLSRSNLGRVDLAPHLASRSVSAQPIRPRELRLPRARNRDAGGPPGGAPSGASRRDVSKRRAGEAFDS